MNSEKGRFLGDKNKGGGPFINPRWGLIHVYTWRKTKVVLAKVASRIIGYVHVRIYLSVMKSMVRVYNNLSFRNITYFSGASSLHLTNTNNYHKQTKNTHM